MSLVRDADGMQIQTLLQLVEVNGRRILEIGCGDGHLTWGYAGLAGYVLGLDPKEDEIIRARETAQARQFAHVHFVPSTIADFTPDPNQHLFDLAVFGWSL